MSHARTAFGLSKGLQIIIMALVCWALAVGFTYALWALVLWLLGDIP